MVCILESAAHYRCAEWYVRHVAIGNYLRDKHFYFSGAFARNTNKAEKIINVTRLWITHLRQIFVAVASRTSGYWYCLREYSTPQSYSARLSLSVSRAISLVMNILYMPNNFLPFVHHLHDGFSHHDFVFLRNRHVYNLIINWSNTHQHSQEHRFHRKKINIIWSTYSLACFHDSHVYCFRLRAVMAVLSVG